jgi:histidine kinase/DNA gyrase B/HSP90-like ATPase
MARINPATEIVPPDPGRMIEGLRDTGYEFNTAVADLVDNSIAAKSRVVNLAVGMDFRGNIRVSIADNGIGMDRSGLINAMKYGSEKRPDPASLGKFGLGLKTASTAFCKRLSVISRPSAKATPLQATWDLDHVANEKKWELLLPIPGKDGLAHLEKVAKGSSGTVVVWENVDRLLKAYDDPAGGHARNALKKVCSGLEEHLAMVFQRFLDPKDKRAPNIEMYLNDAQILAWDPFCVGESDLVAKETVPVELGKGREAEFSIRAFVLPRGEEFSSEEAAKRARLSNDRQGIYIYRQNRLIHAADWLGIYQKEPHGTLLRVEFSFDHRLDDAFHIDIKKSRILLNEDLWNWLADEFLPPPRRAADERYRKGQKKSIRKAAESAHDSSNASISAKEGDLDTAKVKVLDPKTQEVEITNPQGRVRLKLKLGSALKPGQCFVEPVDGIEDGVLWEPALIDGHKAVRINTAHPYYHKVYVPNLASGVTIQGMDSLLWALCGAELGTVNDATKRHFAELRFEVARLLRRLVEDLPEPVTDVDKAA